MNPIDLDAPFDLDPTPQGVDIDVDLDEDTEHRLDAEWARRCLA